MLQIFVTVVLAVIAGGILLKFWKEILGVIVLIISVSLYVVLSILELPIKIIMAFFPNMQSEKRIIRAYDKIFFEARNMKEVVRISRKIQKIHTFLKKQEEKKQNKKVIRVLNDAKWVL